MVDRITDPKRVSGEQIKEILARRIQPTIQFSKPGTSRFVLKAVNKLCALFGDKLQVRFYAHYGDRFDASILRHLPDVRWLSVDCLMHIDNEDEILALPKLSRLGFGVHHFDRPSFLSGLDLSRLTYLVLSENRKKNFDLSPLSDCSKLEELFLNGHTKNISAISTLPSLRTLSLGSIAKRQDLEFVNGIPQLEALTIVLGGRENIDELAHSELRELEVIRVRALSTLGDLLRFPALTRLQVEDQLQLHSVSVAGTNLREVSLHNCKNLERVEGLVDLPGLRVFRTSRTKLDLDALLHANWPESMESVALYSGSQKWNNEARRLLDEKGY